MFCPNCGAPQDEGTKFCGQCGAPIPTMDLEEQPFAAAPSERPASRGVMIAVAVVAVLAILSAIAAAVLLFAPVRQEKPAAPKTEVLTEDSGEAPEEEPSVDAPKTSGSEENDADWEAFLGVWRVPGLDGTHQGSLYTFSRQDNDFYFKGEGYFRSGNRLDELEPVRLEIEGSTAVGSYAQDGRGNHGTIRLKLEDNGIRATVTAEGGDGWSLACEDVLLLSGSYPETEAPEIDSEQQALEAFEVYLFSLVDAINSGDFSRTAGSMVPDSSIYRQQEKLVRNLYARGVTESVNTYYVESGQQVSDSRWNLRMYEAITVTQTNGSSKVVEQHYTYVIDRQEDGSWLLSDLY